MFPLPQRGGDMLVYPCPLVCLNTVKHETFTQCGTIMLAHHLRRWVNISPVLGYRLVFGDTLNVGRWPNIYLTLGRCWLVTATSSKLEAIILDQLLFPANTKDLYNICTASAQRLRRWFNIVHMSVVYWVERSPVNTKRWTVMIWCWASVADGGPAWDR